MIRVLIADDHAILRAGLRALLSSEPDIEVVGEAADALEVVDRAKEHTPDVILLDISMPHGGGIQAIPKIRAVAPNAKVLAVTQHDDPAYLRAVLAAGGAGYVVKRAGHLDLVHAVRTLSEGRAHISVSLPDESLQNVLSEKGDPQLSGKPGAAALSPREREVLEFVAHGYTYKEIASRLGVSLKTVQTYRSRISEKLGLRTRADLVRYALEFGMLAPDEASNPDLPV